MGEPAMDFSRRFLYKDYVEWPDSERWELIHGEPCGMAAPTAEHQDWVLEIGAQLKAQLKGKPCKPYIAPVDLLPYVKPGEALNSSDTVVQPDVLVLCNPEQNRHKALVGAPVFILEVLSVTTAWRDENEKLKVYEAVGVKEFFLLNPSNHHVRAYRLGPEGRYGKPEVWVDPEVVPLISLPGVSLDFTVTP